METEWVWVEGSTMLPGLNKMLKEGFEFNPDIHGGEPYNVMGVGLFFPLVKFTEEEKTARTDAKAKTEEEAKKEIERKLLERQAGELEGFEDFVVKMPEDKPGGEISKLTEQGWVMHSYNAPKNLISLKKPKKEIPKKEETPAAPIA